jgi:hypothetical protein
MTNSNDDIQQDKVSPISPEFNRRLHHLKPGQKIRVIVCCTLKTLKSNGRELKRATSAK